MIDQIRNRTTQSLVVVRVRRRRFVIQKELRIQRRRDRLERQRSLIEVEAIGKIVRRRVRVTERGQTERAFDELQYAAEIMLVLGNVFRPATRRI